MPHWLIQKLPKDDQKLIYAVQEENNPVHVCDPNDFDFLPRNKPIIFHGSVYHTQRIHNRRLFRPFAWFDPYRLSCRAYYSYWHHHLATEQYGFYTLKEIQRLADWIFRKYGGKFFIRPNSNDKIFTGTILTPSRLPSFLLLNEDLDPLTVCVVGQVASFQREWRLIVADGKVIAGSQYMDGPCFCVDPNYPKEAVALAEKAASFWSPHPIYCLDIGLTKKGYRIIECGSINCAGFYQCEIRPIVKAMNEIAEREFALAR